MKIRLSQSILVAALLCSGLCHAQKIQIDNSFTPQQLIEDHLVDGCVQVSNISSTVNGSVNGFTSYGYFERDLSNFPFENGILLSTGNATSGGNTTNDNILNDGELSWGTDPDLEAALGITNTYNATTIEFDFISISNLIQFNYILASEEYFGNFPCDYSDGFAFLIREASSAGPYTNIALIPGTSIPVNTNTIHDEIVGFCPPENEEYFDGYSMGDTNYNGRTVVMTASASITPNLEYHIKLIIADQTDENYDSAVFIQANSFNPTVDLGPDVTTCAEDYILDGDVENPLAVYSWYRDGVLIGGAVNPELNVTTSGTYTVQISIPLNNEECIIEDTVVVTLNSTQTANPLSDYELCDDASNDGVETFDLSTKTTEAENSVPPGNYNVSYHLTANDANLDINPILTPIQNSSNPQTIFVRIEDIDNGCLAFSSFQLIVNPMPEINSPVSLQYCDDEVADGSVAIELTELDSNITQGNTDLNVTYHYTQNDADTGENPIPSPYVNSMQVEQLFIRVVDSNTGCWNTSSFTIEVLDRPVVDEGNIPPLNACEDDGDGFALFDLTVIIPEILAQVSDATITFHETAEDAENGTNPIADESNYENIIQDVQTIYIRVVDNSTGCHTVVPIELHTNLLLTGVNTENFSVCDDESNDGIHDFNLDVVALQIINDLEDITIIFYESQEDLDNDINPIDQSVPYTVTSSPTTLYVRIIAADCESQAEIALVINPPVVIDPVEPIDYCDTDSDGFVSIETALLDSYIIGSAPNLTVTYFLSEDDAENNQNQLTPFYTNTANPQLFYARVQHDVTSCHDVVPVEVNVIPAPETNTPSEIVICDNDQDAFFLVDLETVIPELVSDTTNLTISFHEVETDAQNNNNPISNPSNYNASTQTIFIRVESTITGCFAMENLGIIVNTQPDFVPITNFQNCETDGNQTAEFLFSEKDEEILNGQTGKTVLYFETEADAENRINIIDKTQPYTNTSSPQTIYVRVENDTDQDCYGVSSFIIEVGSIPLFTPPTNFIVCDDLSNDGVHTFDLNEKVDEINSGTPENLTLSFHLSFEDAEASENALDDLIYTNIENPQQIYVRIENGTYCHAIAEFGLNVVQVPTVNLPSAMEQCDNDYDGSTIFDLTVSEFEILDVRSDDIEVSYFESESDLENDINPINNPGTYANISNPQTVYVRVLNLISGCYAVLPLDLIVNLPPQLNDIPEINTCENEDDSYNLDEATEILLNESGNIEISYHSSQIDAENQENPLPTVYNYGSTSDTIFIRAENNQTGCLRIQSFDLIVNENPQANQPDDLERCDDDYDLITEFDLNTQEDVILGGQDPGQHNITYHETDLEAENGENPLDPISYEAFDGQIIYVRVENNSTGCYGLTSFGIRVHRKPEVDIEDQAICLDNLPLVVDANTFITTDTYLWSTGETTSSIEIDEIGTYSVTVTTSNGCETTSEFNVIESEAATIEITETVDFSDPNNITITISGIGNYLYILDDGEPQESNVFENVSLGYHTITVIDLNGCGSVTTEVLVIDAPKFMTPNSDGYFDTWHIVGVETLPGTTIDIFDRYGKHLAHLTSSSEGWDGRYNGLMMPATDYWFSANVVQGSRQFQVKGHFALRR